MDDQPGGTNADTDLDKPAGAPMAPPSAAAEHIGSTPEPTAPAEPAAKTLSGLGGEKILTPIDPSLSPSVTNVNPRVAASTGAGEAVPSLSSQTTVATTPTVVSAAPPPVVTSSPDTPAQQPDITAVEQPWRPNQAFSASSPGAILGMGLLCLFAAISCFTFGIELNSWIKIIILLVVCGTTLYFAMRSYESDNNQLTLLGMLIATIILVGTIFLSSIYVYYKVKAEFNDNGFNSSGFN